MITGEKDFIVFIDFYLLELIGSGWSHFQERLLRLKEILLGIIWQILFQQKLAFAQSLIALFRFEEET